MKKILIFNLLIISNLTAQKITLNEAVKLGLGNRVELKTQALQVRLAESETQKIKARWKPQVNANADVRINTQLQTSIVPFDVTGQNPGQPSELQFGLPYNNTFSVLAEQKLFDANKKSDLELVRLQTSLQASTLDVQKATIRQGITEAYFLVIYNQEKVSFSERNLKRAQEQLENAKVKFVNGTMIENDLKRFEVEVRNIEILLKKSKVDVASASEILKYRMGLKPEQNVELSENLNTLLNINSSTPNSNINQNAEIKNEEISLSINQLNQNKQKFSNYPTVSAYGNYTLLQQINVPNPFKSGSIFPFNFVGVKVNIPIFDGKQAKLQANDFIIRQEINRQNIEKLQDQYGFEARNALQQIENAKLAIEESKNNIEQAQKVLKIDQFRFEKGVFGYSDLKNTERSLQDAESIYLNNAYQLLVAMLSYKKAVGGYYAD